MKTFLEFKVRENDPAFKDWPKYRIDDANGTTVAEVFGENNKELGLILAAAPKLYAALVAYNDAHNGTLICSKELQHAMQLANEALAQAEGNEE